MRHLSGAAGGKPRTRSEEIRRRQQDKVEGAYGMEELSANRPGTVELQD